MPILEGSQGTGKSSALRVLGGEWFAECHESITTKDFYQVLKGAWLVEISEMHSFDRSEVERIKGIISCAVDRYRAPYGRNAEDHPRQSVFAGTTNRDDWQRDDTGARRFWAVRCGAIDTAWLAVHRDQLFAEAVARFRAGESWWSVPSAEAAAEADERRPRDTWEDALRSFLHHAAIARALPRHPACKAGPGCSVAHRIRHASAGMGAPDVATWNRTNNPGMGEDLNDLPRPFRDVNRACTRWLIARGLYVDDETYRQMISSECRAAAWKRLQATRKNDDKIDRIVDELSADE
jgi:predicted P-loop ATPase